MSRNRHTWTFYVALPTRVFRDMVGATPVYDDADVRRVLRHWWRGGKVSEEVRRVSVHLSALIDEDALVETFDRMQKLPPRRRFKREGAHVLIRMSPAAMEASARAAKRLRSSTRGKVDLQLLRHDTLRHLVREIYGV